MEQGRQRHGCPPVAIAPETSRDDRRQNRVTGAQLTLSVAWRPRKRGEDSAPALCLFDSEPFISEVKSLEQLSRL